MATIRQKGDSWHVQVRKKGYPIQTKTFESYKVAKEWAAVIESEMSRGIFVSRAEAERTTLYEAIERYINEVLPHQRGGHVEVYRLRALQRDSLSLASLAGISGADIAKLRDASAARGLAPSSVSKIVGLIRNIYNVAAKEWGMTGLINPVASIKLPKITNARVRRLEQGEEERIIEAIEQASKHLGERANAYVLPLTLLALETAGRQSELLSLTWQQIDLDKRTMRLRGIDGRETKNGDAWRDVPLSSKAIAILAELKRKSKSLKVFNTTAMAIKISWRRACVRAGLDNLHFHDLRHEATSRLAEVFAVHELAKITGHKDTRMLMRYYHPRMEDLARKLA